MSECTRTKTKTVNLGRLPVYVGPFDESMDPDIGFHKYNIVSYLGSSFINLVEGNKRTPVDVAYDASGNIESYDLKEGTDEWTGWFFVANAMEAQLWGERCKRIFDDNFFSLEFDKNTGDLIGTYGVDGNIKEVNTNYDPNSAEYMLGDLYMRYEDGVN